MRAPLRSAPSNAADGAAKRLFAVRWREAGGIGRTAAGAERPTGSDRLQVGRRHLALLAAFQVEADLLAFIQAAEAGTFDGRDMDEHVLRSVARLDEAVALLGIEPFDRAFGHRVILLAIRRSARCGPECLSSWEHRSATRSQRQGTIDPR